MHFEVIEITSELDRVVFSFGGGDGSCGGDGVGGGGDVGDGVCWISSILTILIGS